MKIFNSVIVAFLILGLQPAFSSANTFNAGKVDGLFTKCVEDVLTKGGEGGLVPIPFCSYDLKFELAERQYYQLWGRVILIGDTAFFEVDLFIHSWLASNYQGRAIFQLKRTEMPIQWENYLDRDLFLGVQVEKEIRKRSDGEHYLETLLRPIGEIRLSTK